MALCLSCGPKLGDALRTASTEAHRMADEQYGAFKLLSEHAVEPGEEGARFDVLLEEEHCYRFVAVGADPTAGEDVGLSFKHAEQVVETGTDFLDLTAGDGDLRHVRVVWGVCVWPALAGQLTVFPDLGPQGGVVLVLFAAVGKLSFKDGKDVRSYLKSTGGVDVAALEREEVTPIIQAVFDADASRLPAEAGTTTTLIHEVSSTTEGVWQGQLAIEKGTCYHLLFTSPNCILKYKVTGEKGAKDLTDDGAPDEVGRYGWSHDFCPAKKEEGQGASVVVKLQMLSDDYDQCWFGVHLAGWQAKPKQAAKVEKAKQAARAKVAKQVTKCKEARKKCEKGCTVKKDGKKVTDVNCNHGCFGMFAKCTSAIAFEGELD